MPRRLRAITRRAALGDLELDASRIDFLFFGCEFLPTPGSPPFVDTAHAKRCWRKHRQQLTKWWREGLPREHALAVCINHRPEPRSGRPWAAREFDR